MNNLVGDITDKIEDVSGNKEEELETDVEGVSADSYVQQGSVRFPKFSVDQASFYQNMTDGRRRLRFPTDSPVQKYMQNTKYRNPFYISYTDENGKTYTRKIK